MKSDSEKFIRDIKKTTTPNDWIMARTKNQETCQKIADMICEYGRFVTKESKKYGLKVLNMDEDFDKQVETAINYFNQK